MASEILNFETNRLITGINIIDNMLFFTDDKTEPKKINIDVFKDAVHPSGNDGPPTTQVYGRPFQERDITVIRPSPLMSIDTQLSNLDLGPDASEASVRTDPADVLGQVNVRLRGWARSLDTSVTNVGFYWIQSDTMPSQLQITGTNPRVQAFSRTLGNFDFTLFNLQPDTNYYYVAYAYNDIGEEVLADNILSFKTTAAAASQTSQIIKTLVPIKNGGGVYKLRGSVNNSGGRVVLNPLFRIVRFTSLNGLTKPSTLIGYNPPDIVETVQADFNPTTGFYEFDFNASNDYFWVEFTVIDDSIEISGGVEGDEESTGDSTLRGPDVRYENSRVTTNNSGTFVFLEGQVIAHSNPVQAKGFYITTNNENLAVEYANHASDATIFKVPVPTDAVEDSRVFQLNTNTITGLTLTEDDVLYVMVYGDDGVEARTDVIKIVLKNNASGVNNPGIITLSPEKEITNTNLSLKIGIKVDSNGYNPIIDGFYVNTTEVKSLGCIVYKSQVDELRSLSSTERSEKLLELLNENKASQIIFKQNTLVGSSSSSTANVTTIGLLHYQMFLGDSVTPLEEGYEYHIMGFATNDELTGYGAPLSIQLANQAEQVPGIITQKVTTSSNNNWFYAKIKEGTISAGQNNFYDAGFAYAPVVDGVAFDFETATYTSFNTLGAGTIQEATSITKINNYIQGRENVNGGPDPAFNKWVIEIPHTSLTAGARYYLQAWVQLVQNGIKYKAGYEPLVGFNNVGGDGIIEFTNYIVNEVVEPPLVTLRASNPTTTGGSLGGSIYLGNERLSAQNLFETAADGIYYAKTSDVVGSNDTAKKNWLIANASKVTPIWSSGYTGTNFAYTFGGVAFDEFGVNTTLTTLDSNTDYSFVAKVTNSAGSKVSNLAYLKTKISGNLNFIEAEKLSISTLEGPTIGYTIIGTGPLARSYTRLYFIKTADATSSNPTAAEIAADPDSGYYTSTTSSGYADVISQTGNHIANGLEAGTSYHFFWEVNFSTGGIKRSNVIQVTTEGGVPSSPLGTLSVDKVALELDPNGSSPNSGGVGSSIRIYLSPDSGDYGIKKGSGNWALLTTAKNNVNGARYLTFHAIRNITSRSLTWEADLFNVSAPEVFTRIRIFQAPGATSGYDGIGIDHRNEDAPRNGTRLRRNPSAVQNTSGIGRTTNLSANNAGNSTGIGRGSTTDIINNGLIDGEGRPSWDINPLRSLRNSNN
jgi:hypothetical protein